MNDGAYEWPIPAYLIEDWGWFESRGYLPAMPGTLVETDLDGVGRYVAYSLEVSEHEAWEFSEACWRLEEGFLTFLTCASPPVVRAVRGWLDQIV